MFLTTILTTTLQKYYFTSVLNKKYSLCCKHRLYSYTVIFVNNFLLQFGKRLLNASYCLNNILVACRITHSKALRSTE